MAKLVIGNDKTMAVPAVVIEKGTTPTGTIQITTNGTHDVTNYATADVQVPTIAPAHYIAKTATNGALKSNSSVIDLTGITEISSYAMAGAYYQQTLPQDTDIDWSSIQTVSIGGFQNTFYKTSNLRSVDLSGVTALYDYACKSMFMDGYVDTVDLSSLTTISANHACESMFSNATLLTNVGLISLTTISGDYACSGMFYGTSSLTSVDLSNVTSISGFYVCKGMFSSSALTSVDLSGVQTISGSYACQEMFLSCSGITTMNFSSLETISGDEHTFESTFRSCSNLTSVSFDKLSSTTALGFYSLMATSRKPTFYDCPKLESISFGGFKASTFANATNQLRALVHTNVGTSAPNGCTIHFPSNFDPGNPDKTFDITTLTGYPTFGGNASYIHLAYDLPATE